MSQVLQPPIIANLVNSRKYADLPTLSAILTPQGLESTQSQEAPLADLLQTVAEGVYTITRTYQRHAALLLDAHLDRLEESAALEQIPLRLNRAALRAALRQLIEQSGNAESRFSISVSRQAPTHLYLAVEPLRGVPAELRQQGVAVATITTQRSNPTAKSSQWLHQRQRAAANLPSDIYETLLISTEEALLECAGANFYAILDGALYTADEGILNGISRRVLLQSVGDLLPVHLKPVTLGDVPRLSEAFLTSSSRGVVPIVTIDEQKIGTGTPGELTRELARRYDAWTDTHLEPI